jgi:hypothetical protein
LYMMKLKSFHIFKKFEKNYRNKSKFPKQHA